MDRLAPPDSAEHPWKLTFIVEGPIRRWNPPVAVLECGSHQLLLEGENIPSTCRDVVSEARSTGTKLISSLLENTSGGLIAKGRLASAPIAHLQYMGIPTTAFVDEEASSFGGTLLMACPQRVVRARSSILFHQFHRRPMGDEKEGDIDDSVSPEKYPLVSPRHAFRRKLLRWLTGNTDPDHHPWVLGRAYEAFQDPENHLDDVRFTGEELHIAGAVNRAVNSRSSLAKAYLAHHQTPPKQWHPRIQQFFT